jgi:hypothetical protein
MSRKGPLVSWAVWGALGVVLVLPAGGQNLDAGKSGAQIFSQVCANCHRGPRALRNASTSFLREHYTTSPAMAAAVAAYLSAAGREPAPAQSPVQPERPRAPINPGVANASEKPAADAAHDTRHDPIVEPQTLFGLLRGSSESERIEVARPANSVGGQAPPSAPPHSPILEDFEQ